MLKGSHSEAISIAFAGIGAIPALEDLDIGSVKLGVVLRLLNAAGWDVFDISEAVLDCTTGNGKADFALFAVPSREKRGAATPQVQLEVKPFSENLDRARFERRLVAHCARVGAPLGVLTNGRRPCRPTPDRPRLQAAEVLPGSRAMLRHPVGGGAAHRPGRGTHLMVAWMTDGATGPRCEES